MSSKKTSRTLVAAAVAGTAILSAALTATRRKQERARAEGRHVPHGPYEAVVKRPLDVALAAGSLVVLSPIIAATALLVRIKLGSPVIFKQERPGLNAEPFLIYKFRTMTDERDENGKLLSDDVRLTPFGKWLRSTSLDELPELFNILKGDMAIIGPRPLLSSYLPYYTKEEMRRHDVRPGLSGYAQVNGRNAIASWEQRFRYDQKYVNNVTFLVDARIVMRTIWKALKRADVLVGSEIMAGRLDQARRDSVASHD